MVRNRQTRLQKVIAVLGTNKHKPVPLPEIQQAGGAQFGARIKEARALGYVIENMMERTEDGQRASWYTLVREPGEVLTLFSEPDKSQTYRDPEEEAWN